MKYTLVFPGQGSQYVGMGYDLYESYPVARKIFDTANETLGFDLAKLCFFGPEEHLMETRNTQPAVLTVSVACLAILLENGVSCHAAAGHSLGEYSALVAAGALSFEDAVRLVRRRGTLMQEAVPLGAGGMAAIIGLDQDSIERACQEVADLGICEIANLNSPQQVVIAGEMAAVRQAMLLTGEAGAKRCVLLPVSAPFHCSMMRQVGAEMDKELARVPVGDPVCDVVCNATAGYVRSRAEVRAALVRQVFSPVRWMESIELLLGAGTDCFLEVGPGRVLTGLIKRINKQVRTANVGDCKSLHKLLAGQGEDF